ncbi:MAG: polysulfide reductase NrfD [Gemmatimonadota bacterium]|jgi:Fe-S-cluster-containing dehydrogenase component/formate-dependent nitrite reductase membrane component NrfD
MATTEFVPAAAPARWAKVIDHTRCIGCHACTTACKSENRVPLSVTRTYVKYVDVGVFPETRRAFQVTRCNQCEDAPCVMACPTAAMFRRRDGIVDFDKSACIGCKACIAACPYDAIFINPEDHSAEKCNLCAHRIDIGLEPACVVVCPTEAIVVGDVSAPDSRVARLIGRDAVTVRRPEKGTRPALFYKGAHQATLDPIAARRPEGGLFLWSEQGDVPYQVTSGHPGAWNSSAAAVLAYDVPHRAPWDWRVSLYTWTKSIASGTWLVAWLLAWLGSASWTGPLWLRAAPLIALGFLALTGAILVWDLEQPGRFHYIFLRPQWKSWLVRGGFIIAAWSMLLAVHVIIGLAGNGAGTRLLAWAGVPLAIATAVYTAYLFAQARARDLWQNPLSPTHLLVQAVLAGSAVLAVLSVALEPAATHALLVTMGAAAGLHLLLVGGESTLTHGTAHERLAWWELVRGRWRPFFFAGLALVAPAALAPWLGVWTAAPALVGLLAYEHAWVQAGQSVPLA